METNEVLARVDRARDESNTEKGSFDGVPRKLPVTISVIIPAHNEEDYLAQTLAALNCQDYPAHEIVVVANGCTDRTEEAARGKCHRLVTLSRKNLGVARNLGARMALGDLLVFLDADTLL